MGLNMGENGEPITRTSGSMDQLAAWELTAHALAAKIRPQLKAMITHFNLGRGIVGVAIRPPDQTLADDRDVYFAEFSGDVEYTESDASNLIVRANHWSIKLFKKGGEHETGRPQTIILDTEDILDGQVKPIKGPAVALFGSETGIPEHLRISRFWLKYPDAILYYIPQDQAPLMPSDPPSSVPAPIDGGWSRLVEARPLIIEWLHAALLFAASESLNGVDLSVVGTLMNQIGATFGTAGQAVVRRLREADEFKAHSDNAWSQIQYQIAIDSNQNLVVQAQKPGCNTIKLFAVRLNPNAELAGADGLFWITDDQMEKTYCQTLFLLMLARAISQNSGHVGKSTLLNFETHGKSSASTKDEIGKALNNSDKRFMRTGQALVKVLGLTCTWRTLLARTGDDRRFTPEVDASALRTLVTGGKVPERLRPVILLIGRYFPEWTKTPVKLEQLTKG